MAQDDLARRMHPRDRDEYLVTLRGVLFEIQQFHSYWTERLETLIALETDD